MDRISNEVGNALKPKIELQYFMRKKLNSAAAHSQGIFCPLYLEPRTRGLIPKQLQVRLEKKQHLSKDRKIKEGGEGEEDDEAKKK